MYGSVGAPAEQSPGRPGHVTRHPPQKSLLLGTLLLPSQAQLLIDGKSANCQQLLGRAGRWLPEEVGREQAPRRSGMRAQRKFRNGAVLVHGLHY
jgi:hypothetical protein